MGQAILPEGAAPPTPAAGYVAVYAKADGLLYGKDDAGTETQISNSAASNTATTKLPDIDVTQAAGALTVACNTAIYQDFRSTTLTDGTPTTVLCDPADLVIPDGATLGFTSGVAGDAAVIWINNAGTIEKAVVNLSGGVNLDESGVISTTAIGTGSDSAGVIYSTTARTNVAYKVVKRFTAVNTAGSWGDPSSVNDDLKYKMLTIPAQSATGTSVDFTGIPTWAKEITLMLNGVSTNGTSIFQVQAGAGSIATTGYLASTVSLINTANTTPTVASTTGIPVGSGNTTYDSSASAIRTGAIILTNAGGYTWMITGGCNVTGVGLATQVKCEGGFTLSGVLDRIRFSSVNGTDAMDAGTLSLLVKGY